jgi:hypothetical protein
LFVKYFRKLCTVVDKIMGKCFAFSETFHKIAKPKPSYDGLCYKVGKTKVHYLINNVADEKENIHV